MSLWETFCNVPTKEKITIRPRPTAPLEPYAPRRFGSLGEWRIGRFRLKAYGINVRTDPGLPLVAEPIVEAARKHVGRRLAVAERESGHYGLGYVILHEGADAVWLLIDWWIEAEVACHLLSSARKEAPTAFSPVTRPLLACVWEMAPIAHERDAWIRHMLKAGPDPAGYLADRLPDGVR